MNKKTLLKLEYDKIIELLTEQASSQGGKMRCQKLNPKTTLEDIELLQEQTADAFTRIVRKGRPSFGNVNTVNDSLMRLDIGGALNATELLRICKLLENTARVKSYGRHDTVDDTPDCLDVFFEQLEPLTPLSSHIRQCIIDEDEISDEASSTLKSIRRNIHVINDKVHSTLNSLVNGSYRTYLQDAIITMRGDRYCLPVKAEYRSQVNGMIHDQSSTGSTLFIEPMAVVKLNNDLKELYGKEQEEIQIILASLSNEAAAYTQEIKRRPCSIHECKPSTIQHQRTHSYPGRASSITRSKNSSPDHHPPWRHFRLAHCDRSKYRRKNRFLKNNRTIHFDGAGRAAHPCSRSFRACGIRGRIRRYR